MTTTVRTPDGTGSGWAGREHHDCRASTPAALGARAIEKARASANPVAVEPGRYTVVLEPTAVGNLLRLLAFAMKAPHADEGRSFFTKPGRRQQDRQPRWSTSASRSQPTRRPRGARPAPSSATGCRPAHHVGSRTGVVQNLAYDRYWAQKQGASRCRSSGSLRMSGGTASLEQMIASTERGLLVTRLWYIRPVDPRTILYTGLTRDGTFLIERGKVTRAVKNLRWNESPVFMLNNVEAMGRPVRVSASEDGSPGAAIVVPPVKARDFTFTSLSDAV
jgi:predicted Zn-dependent protease